MQMSLGPKWLNLLPGLEILAKPLTRTIARKAVDAMQAASEKVAAEGGDADAAAFAADDAYNITLARLAIVDWRGDIVGEDGEPAKATPENVELLMEQALPASAFNTVYVLPFIRASLEKNVSSPSSNGATPMTEMDIAADAKSQKGNPTVPGNAPS